MKTIQITPAVAYVNGKRMLATQLNVVSVSDNLFDHVIFKYTLLDEANQWAGEATYALEGIEQYVLWDASPDGAYEIVAKGVGLEIIPCDEGKVAFLEVV